MYVGVWLALQWSHEDCLHIYVGGEIPKLAIKIKGLKIISTKQNRAKARCRWTLKDRFSITHMISG